jgi:hypothetical protein
LDVAVTQDASKKESEMYSWAGAGRFNDRDLFEMIPDGAMSTGTFSSLLGSIFRPGAADFFYNGDTNEAGKELCEFGFDVSKEVSQYSYVFGKNREQQVKVGYGGTILVDPLTSDLMRLTIHTDPLPPESGACEVVRTVLYGRMSLNGSSFLLPTQAQISVIHPDETVAENIVTYSGCREFRGESNLRFDSAPVIASPTSGVREFAPPAGLPFTLTFTDSIDPDAAAAGDLIRAKLITSIRDKTTVFAPEGTPVLARIRRITRYYGRQPSLALAVGLESIELEGTSYPLPANFDPGVRRFVKPGKGLSVRVQIGPLDGSLISESATFEFTEPNSIEAGLESKWFTSAR